MTKYFKPNNSRILYLNSSFNCVKNCSISLTRTSGGTGYTSAPTISVIPALGDMGFGCTATATYATGAVSAITITNNGKGYNTLPTIKLSGGGNPGTITGTNITNKGSGYLLAPTVSLSGGGGTGFTATATIDNIISSTFTITAGGTGYTTGQSLSFTGGGGSGAVATITATSGVITGITLTNAGGGYTSAPTITISSGGTGGVITCSLINGVISGIIITNGGSNYSTTPTIVFTPTNGGTGAVATPVLTLGTSAVITPTFLRTYSCSWVVPDIENNDLAKLSTVNIIASGTTATTPYTFRIMNLLYDSRNSYFSDYGSPILSLAQTTNICSYGSLSGENFSIILQPQTIRQIEISIDDSITTQSSGILVAINFVIAIEIEEYDPNYTQVGDVYGEASNRIRPLI